MNLTERDRRILELIQEQKFVTAELVRHEFANGSMTEVYRRLRECEKAGYLHSFQLLTSNRKVYVVSRNWHRHSQKEAWGHLPYFNRPRTYLVAHDIKVTEVRIKLESFISGSHWIPEIALRADKGREDRNYPFINIGDGLLQTGSWANIMIEVECSNKSESRTINIMRNWIAETSLNLVLYVATEEGVCRRLTRLLKRLQYVEDSTRIAIVRFNDLMVATESIEVFTVDGTRFIHSDLLPREKEADDGISN